MMQWVQAAALAMTVSAAPPPPEPEAVLTLPDEIIEQLDARIIRHTRSSDRRLDQVVRYMLRSGGLNLSYLHSPTRDVTGAIEDGQANCLSFTLIFLAMADHLGLDTTAREVQAPINWRRDGSSVYESGHVNVRVVTPQRRAVVDFEPDPIRSRQLANTRRARDISRERLLAHFYNNRAAELLGEGWLEAARQWSDVALELAPEFSAALNNRGVIENRLGHTDEARRHFERALELAPENTSVLFNLYELYQREEQEYLAEKMLERIDGIRSRDVTGHSGPFFPKRMWAANLLPNSPRSKPCHARPVSADLLINGEV
ncbi:tetratricopeptide repeat protein [Wenzhouxiangella sp. AB-CW3]|uniref:tetratricopeptide repeat protein n=1 Tax=Wenzhouxiangella sp. AB-CW3 TaxID=2771012 RepID=UPI00168B5FEE|nr:tetratricopeptide repeat protein [Wenzhouxiangella sp. AB-CW3]QOC22833.1 tetratricopeptide repeat protein [Wenzhouxiangella sp. AB-CW3]